MAHYYAGRSGDSFVDATIHTDDDCDELDGPVRPLADSSVPGDADLCGGCIFDIEDAEMTTPPMDSDTPVQDAVDSGESDVADDEYPVRVESYTRGGKCGYFDPDTMDDPCARAEGWGRDADDGPCTDHHD